MFPLPAFPPAPPADIARAAARDGAESRALATALSGIHVASPRGGRPWILRRGGMGWVPDTVAPVLFALSQLAPGARTVGGEATGCFPATAVSELGAFRRLGSALFNAIIGPNIVSKLGPQWQRLWQLSLQIHLALFYMGYSPFLNISDMLFNLRHVKPVPAGNPDTNRRQKLTFAVLGVLLLLQASFGTLSLVKTAYAHRAALLDNKNKQRGSKSAAAAQPLLPSIAEESSESADAPVCTLCLDPRKDPTATKCGHVFCWQCVAEWCTGGSPFCPLCRQPIEARELLPLYSFQ